MLGLAKHAQLAGWGSGGGPLRVLMLGQGEIESAVYQEPVFSYLISPDSRPQWQLESNAVAEIDNTVNDNKGFALATTFRMRWNEATIDPVDENEIYGFLHECNIKSGQYSGFNSLNMFLQLRNGELNITSRFETNTIQRVTKDLPGPFTDYNNRWMTLIFAGSQDPATFSNFRPEDGQAGFGAFNSRSTLYDTETGEVLQTIDFVPSGLDFPGLADWPQFQGEVLPVPFNRDGEFGITVQGSMDAFMAAGPQPYRLGNIWGSLGRGFDPLVHGRELLTVRPAQTIGGATAWYNIQFAQHQEPVNGQGPYFIAPSGADYMQSNTGRAFDLTFGNNQTEFNAGFSDTIFPKDRS